MATDDRTSPVHVFTVRVWKEDLGAGSEYRGSVRDVASDAFRSFRDWSDMVAFMVGRLERGEARASRAEGGRDDRPADRPATH